MNAGNRAHIRLLNALHLRSLGRNAGAYLINRPSHYRELWRYTPGLESSGLSRWTQKLLLNNICKRGPACMQQNQKQNLTRKRGQECNCSKPNFWGCNIPDSTPILSQCTIIYPMLPQCLLGSLFKAIPSTLNHYSLGFRVYRL